MKVKLFSILQLSSIAIRLLFLAAFTIFSPALSANESIVVIVSNTAQIESLVKDDVRSIFMGKLLVFPNTAIEVTAVDQPRKSDIRKNFYIAVAKKTPRKMNSYWARYLFTGKGHPPKEYSDSKTIISTVTEDPGVIGYIPASEITDQVKVLYTIGGDQ